VGTRGQDGCGSGLVVAAIPTPAVDAAAAPAAPAAPAPAAPAAAAHPPTATSPPTAECPAVYTHDGARLVTGAAEAVRVWNARTGEETARLEPPRPSEGTALAPRVTSLASNPTEPRLAAGYSDGTVRLWDVAEAERSSSGGGPVEPVCILAGHRGAVVTLRWSQDGARLASGGQDTACVVWDPVAEAGLFRLRGHRGVVTDLCFLGGGGRAGPTPTPRGANSAPPPNPDDGPTHLATSSKDGSVRVWDLAAQACCQVAPGHVGGEVWTLDVSPDGRRLATAGNDAEVRLFRVGGAAAGVGDEADEGNASLGALGGAGLGPSTSAAGGDGEDDRDGSHDVLFPMGSLRRAAPERCALVRWSACGRLLTAASAGKGLELWRSRDAKEARRHARRRRQRVDKKRAERLTKLRKTKEGGPTKGKGNTGDGSDGSEDDDLIVDVDGPPVASDELAPLHEVRLSHRLSAVALHPRVGTGSKGNKGTRERVDGQPALARLALCYANNSVDELLVAEGGFAKSAALRLPGHRSDVRSVALAPDDSALVSTSQAGLKVWEPRTGRLLRSVDEVGYGLCSIVAPGGRHAVVGTKEGKLEVVDLHAGTLVKSIDAHDGPVWSVCLAPGGAGVLSGGADKDVKFWDFEAVTDDEDEGGQTREDDDDISHPKLLTLEHARTLRLSDDVLCVRVSPDGRLVAASLNDATIKVFFFDTLKFYLSLYGHKLPAFALDISSDSRLLVSGSADKNLRIWGLDFGDCHRSLLAHSDSVMGVAFVPRTHYLFSVGRDGDLGYWDCDKFERLLRLGAHHGEAWCLAVSSLGDAVVTGGHDRSIRRWERTDEPFFVDEEKERRLESLFEEDAGGKEDDDEGGGAAARDAGRDDAAGATGVAGRRTQEAVTGADAILDAIDMAVHEEKRLAEAAEAAARGAGAAAPNPLMLGLSPDAYVLQAVRGVRAAELEQTLLVLPFPDALRLLSYLERWLTAGEAVELVARCSTLLVRIHHLRLATAEAGALRTLAALRAGLRGRVRGLRATLGFNLAAAMAAARHAREATHDVDEAGLFAGDQGLRALVAPGTKDPNAV